MKLSSSATSIIIITYWSLARPLLLLSLSVHAFQPLVNNKPPLSSLHHQQHVRSYSPLYMVTSSSSESSSSSSSSSVLLPETQPLASHTFAGMVEHGMIEKFCGNGSTKDIERILKSWRLLELDYEHNEYIGLHEPNISKENSNCIQHCHSYVPNLTIKEFWNIKQFDWTSKLESKYQEILKEFQSVVLKNPTELIKKGNNIWSGALTDDATSYGTGWKTLVLMDRGIWDPVRTYISCWGFVLLLWLVDWLMLAYCFSFLSF